MDIASLSSSQAKFLATMFSDYPGKAIMKGIFEKLSRFSAREPIQKT